MLNPTHGSTGLLESRNFEGTYTIRTMQRNEVSLVTQWAQAEGWSPGLYDVESVFDADPEGCFLGEIDDQPVSLCYATEYQPGFAFAGMLIVKPEYRGRGVTRRLLRETLRHVGHCNIGIDSPREMQQKFARLGFRIAHRHNRFQGIGPGENRQGVIDLSLVPESMLLQFDHLYFPVQRAAFLRSWCSRAEHRTIGHVAGGILRGYAVMRPCDRGWRVGPLFADSENVAESLLLACFARSESQPILIDVPEVNPAAVTLVERFGMELMFEGIRMYSGGAPNIAMDGIYGTTGIGTG